MEVEYDIRPVRTKARNDRSPAVNVFVSWLWKCGMSSDINRRTPVEGLITKASLVTARPSAEVQDIAQQMKYHDTSSVIVLDNVPNKPLG